MFNYPVILSRNTSYGKLGLTPDATANEYTGRQRGNIADPEFSKAGTRKTPGQDF